MTVKKDVGMLADDAAITAEIDRSRIDRGLS